MCTVNIHHYAIDTDCHFKATTSHCYHNSSFSISAPKIWNKPLQLSNCVPVLTPSTVTKRTIIYQQAVPTTQCPFQAHQIPLLLTTVQCASLGIYLLNLFYLPTSKSVTANAPGLWQETQMQQNRTASQCQKSSSSTNPVRQRTECVP